MDRLPITAIVISGFIAVLLWMMAQHLDRQATATAPVGASVERPAVATPVSPAAPCEQVEQELREHIDVARQCTRNSDCMIFDYGYPLQCMMSVAKTQVPALRGEFARYHEACEHRVYYDCPTGDAVRYAVCRENVCSVELLGESELTDETLDYLGIQE